MGNQENKEVIVGLQVALDDVAQHNTAPNRILPMIELARGKRVLNIGCCGSDALTNTNSVHSQFTAVSDYCVGIDIFEEGVKKMQSDGLNAVVANAESFDLGETFDLVILGDVIEHVSNPGRVFDMANQHLNDGGFLAVTTPNPFALTLMAKRILGRPFKVNNEHICWFDPILLSYLLERSGFMPEQVIWTDPSRFALLRWIQSYRKDFHETFGIVARKVKNVS